MSTTFNSLLLGDGSWHNGSGSITYSLLGSAIPSYYPQIDTNSDSTADAYQISSGETFPSLPFGTNPALQTGELRLVEFAIQQLNDVANLNISRLTSGLGDLTFGSFGMTLNSAGTPNQTLSGFAYTPLGGTSGTPSISGDVWINRNGVEQTVYELGSVAYDTYLHEIGHALGLAHPNNDPNNLAGHPTNNNQFTMMSYAAHPSAGAFDTVHGLTPMLYDIQALQSLYGANTSTRTGNTVYFGDGTPGTGTTYSETAYQYGASNMMVEGNRVLLTIWDAGGTDLIDASDLSTNVIINLVPGSFSTIGSMANNVALAEAVSVGGTIINHVENAAGGSGNDSITGNDIANVLLGNAGNDTLHGNAGFDTLRGNAGFDTLFGGIGNDLLDGGAQADNLFGGEGNDTMLGGRGLDRLFGQIGDDVAYGGDGRDALFGQENNDRLFGQDDNDRLFGGRGNDFLDGGNGDDVMIGGAGFDTLLGSTGNDTMTGAFNADIFVFADFGGGWGADTITDFDATNNFEKIDLSQVAAITDFADLFSGHATQVGSDVVIFDVAGGNTITLQNVIFGTLDANDFIF